MLSACIEPAPPPNVLIYVVDTLGADSLGYEDKITETLHFDRFAAEALIFEQARAHSSWTRPSFASILTGTYPVSHGVYDRSSRLRGDAITLPELLREAIERLRPRLVQLIREQANGTPVEASDADLPVDVRATLEALGYLHDEPKSKIP